MIATILLQATPALLDVILVVALFFALLGAIKLVLPRALSGVNASGCFIVMMVLLVIWLLCGGWA